MAVNIEHRQLPRQVEVCLVGLLLAPCGVVVQLVLEVDAQLAHEEAVDLAAAEASEGEVVEYRLARHNRVVVESWSRGVVESWRREVNLVLVLMAEAEKMGACG